MPQTDPYDPFTDPEVLARLKKSPVECITGRFGSGYRDVDLWYVESSVIQTGTQCRRANGTVVVSTGRNLKDSDAHHIEAAWMVELAKNCDERKFARRIIPLINGNIFVVLVALDVSSEKRIDDEPPIRALALALDWLEGEKT